MLSKPMCIRWAIQNSGLKKLILASQAVGGTIWHGIKGFRNSPYNERGLGAITAYE